MSIPGRLAYRIRKALTRDPDRFLRGVPGVVHVGANTGQERDEYHRRGLRVLWVEPIPDVFAELEANLRGYPAQRAVRALVTDRDGSEHQFHVASNRGASSSLLAFKHHVDMWPDIHYERTISLTGITLDTLLAREGISPVDYPALVLDIQGAELMALRGAAASLSRFRWVKAEVADFESYAGCPQVTDIEAFLHRFGFRERYRTQQILRHPAGGAYFDIVYRREGPPPG